MRIVIDMQGAQTESRFRGIGRYTLSFAQAIVRNRGEHEVILALSGLFPESIETVRAAFDGILPQENIRVWYAPGPVAELEPGNAPRREIAELIREAFLASLKPDVIHVTSLFEGYVDDAVTSIGRFDQHTLVSASLYDLIPMLNPEQYLRPNPAYDAYYTRKIEHLKRAGLLLAISDFTREEGLTHLSGDPDRIVSVSTAIEPCFKPERVADDVAQMLLGRFGVKREFVLYTGGSDDRKNLPRLIRAFAALPKKLRDTHQLLFAGRMPEGCVNNLKREATEAGLKSSDLCFSGYVSDEELVQLYNLCKIFVFASWHEGFGLPALEAMACGAAVIGANTSSVPEVIGLEAALFDPLSVEAITAKMELALRNGGFRAQIKEHGKKQARKFSWDQCARRAIDAFVATTAKHRAACALASTNGSRRLRLAFVAPLPPERTGIADYAAELLPALAAHYDLVAIVAQPSFCDDRLLRHCEIRDVGWLYENANSIDRILYQVGNSPFHAHMLPLIRDLPGVVRLHDFYLSGLQSWLELVRGDGWAWASSLYFSHGYGAIRQRFLADGIASAKREFPVNYEILKESKGVVLTSEYTRGLVEDWYGPVSISATQSIPLLKQLPGDVNRKAARQELAIADEDFVICSFGFLDPTKQNHRVLDAWLASSLARDERCKLVFVGENHGGDYGQQLVRVISDHGLAHRVRITGFALPHIFRGYLAAADIAVQLRTDTRGETSAAILDCMAHGLPTILNAHGPMNAFSAEAVWKLPDKFSQDTLVQAFETLWRDKEARHMLGRRAKDSVERSHSPSACAKQYFEVIEGFYRSAAHAAPAVVEKITSNHAQFLDDYSCHRLAESISLTFPAQIPLKRIFLDVTATCASDLKTGIERVARAITLALIELPPDGYRVEPVYLCENNGRWVHRYARKYTFDLLECPDIGLAEDIVEPSASDIVISLDLSDKLVSAEKGGLYLSYRNNGVLTYAVVFDLLPVLMKEAFPPGADAWHLQWLQAVARLDGAICISKAVAEEMQNWMETAQVNDCPRRPFKLSWFHLGADVNKSAPSKGLPDNFAWIIEWIKTRPSFLMVGTVEPRKGHAQALAAFEVLWKAGHEVNLIVVGKEGWRGLPDNLRRTIPETVRTLREHAELGRHLLWLENISDEFLEQIYAASTCLIAGSEGEGFGLPLIEAAQHGIPILARDIPVFREIATESALYFRADDAVEMSAAVIEWLRKREAGAIPVSAEMTVMTWEQSARQLADFITGKVVDGAGVAERRHHPRRL